MMINKNLFQLTNKQIKLLQNYKKTIEIYQYKIKNKMSMKRSPLKTSQKYHKNSVTKLSAPQINPQQTASQINSNLYFCHFKNAMYMGGVKAFQKNGKGLLLHDDGTNAISSYYNDLLHGHNVFFTNYCYLSAEYSKNKIVQAAYRTDGFLLLAFYNNESQLDGKSVLINYITKNILYCTFKKGIMSQKQEQKDFTVINRVFQLGQIDFLIGKKHARVLSYQFQKQKSLMFQKIGNKLIVGYQKHGMINGLAFSYTIRNPNSHYSVQTHKSEDSFELNLIQRGYYINGQLNGFGQKIFKNGNSYIGQFKCDVFQGHGILKNSLKKNWVSGFFERGNLVDLLEYNHEGGNKKCQKIIQAFHQKRSNWINNQITLVNWSFFDEEIQKMISLVPNTQVKTLEQRKTEVLKKIQQNFICQNNEIIPNSSTLRQIQQYAGLKNASSNGDKQSVRKFVRNFIPEGQNAVSPKSYARQRQRDLQRQRNIQNQKTRQRQKFRQRQRQKQKQRLRENQREIQQEKQTQKKQYMSSRRKDSVMNDSRRQKSSIRKSRIFQSQQQAVSPSKSMDSFLKLQKVPLKNQSNKQLLSKNRSSFDINRSRKLQKSEVKPEGGIFSPKTNKNIHSVRFTGQSSPKQHDSKKLIGKSRIFNYLNGEQDDITPKFHYNQKQLPTTKNKGPQESL